MYFQKNYRSPRVLKKTLSEDIKNSEKKKKLRLPYNTIVSYLKYIRGTKNVGINCQVMAVLVPGKNTLRP
jgi:hypothetical protein